jgi:DNA (cytosine-5)-methyltransferase 1
MLYNENDKYAAEWLRNLISAGELPGGDVDERSITELQADDILGHETVHFFAGIGGWPLALRIAGWPGDVPVWTGSCPCQPFSTAGKGLGEKDKRHLWPEMRRLIDIGRPAVVFGEQVASKDGRAWLDGIRAEMEKMGYAFGASDLCAAGIGAPHIRQRIFWVGYTTCESSQRNTREILGAKKGVNSERVENGSEFVGSEPAGSVLPFRIPNTENIGRKGGG